ncbi:hypothetical protein ZONE111905_07945 [Zobellia nedashkovskayae]
MLSLIFILITVLSLVLFYLGTGQNRKVLILSVILLLVTGVLAYSGFFENTETKPPRFLLVIFLGIVMATYFYKIVQKDGLNSNKLLAVHILRIPVELVLYQLFLGKLIPELMTFTGYNFDILVGVSALIILIYLLITRNKLPKLFVILWNCIGILFLTIIVVIAILSSPLPIQQFAFDQPNIALLKFPYIYLPGYIVPIVYLSHILYIRNEISRK